MKSVASRILSVVFLLSAAACFATGEPVVRGAGTNEVLKAVLELSDGSRVIGVPSIQSVPVQTPYAKMDIPLKQIRSLQMGDDHETATLDLQNGDKIKGVIGLGPVLVKTVFGPVTVGVEHVRCLSIRSGDGPPRDGLLLHFAFERDEGERVVDLSEGGNEGRALSVKWMRDERRGGVLQFDGRQALVNAGREPELDVVENLTISVWIRKRPKTFGDTLQVILAKDDGPDWPGRSYMLYMTDLPGRKYLGFGYGVKSGGIDGRHEIHAEGVELADGQWHHVAVVHAAGAGNRLYVDGRSVAEDAEGSPLPSNPNTDTIVGKTQAWESWFFYGAMDDVMIYNRALDASEIRQIYKAQK